MLADKESKRMSENDPTSMQEESRPGFLARYRYWIIVGIIVLIASGFTLFNSLSAPAPAPAPSSTPLITVSPQPSVTPTPSATPSGTPAPSSTPQPTVITNDAPQAPVLPDATKFVNDFMAAWSKPGVGKEAWLAAIRPYVTDSLYAEYENIDIANVPASTVGSIYRTQSDGEGETWRATLPDKDYAVIIHLAPQFPATEWKVDLMSRT